MFLKKKSVLQTDQLLSVFRFADKCDDRDRELKNS